VLLVVASEKKFEMLERSVLPKELLHKKRKGHARRRTSGDLEKKAPAAKGR